MTEIIKILGRPGTGKTYKTLDLTEEEFKNGIDTDELLYFSYTVAASEEGRERVSDRLGIDSDELGENWRTLHSQCFKLLNLNPVQTADGRKRKEFCEKIGINYSLNQETRDASELEEKNVGNELFSAYDWLRSRMRPIDDLDGLFSFENSDVDPKRFMKAWEAYKKKKGIVDFQDMLSGVLKFNLYPEAEVMIVDEFQDMTPLQYKVYEFWRDKMNRVYIAGDPAQAIYTFGGAEPKFLTEEESDRDILLDKTYRLPKEIWEPSKKILETLHDVAEFDIEPTGEGGEFHYLEPEFGGMRGFQDRRLLDWVESSIDNNQDVMAIFRTRNQAQDFENELIERGVPYIAMRGFEVWTKQVENLRDGIKEVIKNGETSGKKQGAITQLLGKDMNKGDYDLADFIYRLKDKTGYHLYKSDRTEKQKKHPLNYFQASAIVENLRSEIFIEPDQVRVGTKHSAKGKEAKVVITSLDTSKRISETMYKEVESEEEYSGMKLTERVIDEREKRVDFVALTRASEKLIVSESAFGRTPNHTLEELQKPTEVVEE